MTVDEYEQALERNLQHLHERVHSGQYWPKPVRRTYIPKSDGGRRPLGIPALEDKIVQGAVAEVLNAVYKADFLGFIPSPIDQNRCAQSRNPIDIMVHGWSTSLFQAKQQCSRMSP